MLISNTHHQLDLHHSGALPPLSKRGQTEHVQNPQCHPVTHPIMSIRPALNLVYSHHESAPVFTAFNHFPNYCFAFSATVMRLDLRYQKPNVTLIVLYYCFFVIYLMSRCHCCGEIIFQDVYFIHYQQLIA